MAVQEGASILQTPSYIVAVLLLLFSALFFVFEKVHCLQLICCAPLRRCLLLTHLLAQLIHWRTESLRKRNKMGLLVRLV